MTGNNTVDIPPGTAPRRAVPALLAAALVFLAGTTSAGRAVPQETALPSAPPGQGLLRLLGISASEESVDYVANKTQFQLHSLLTEQRHPRTWNLSDKVGRDTASGLRMLFSVDDDVAARLDALAADPGTLEALCQEVEKALLEKRRIYIYGCGATGRLAKQMESSFWRPFWRRLKKDPKLWPKLAPRLGPSVEESLVGEMTGADRALISSLEGFEDLQLIGRLQIRDRGVRRGDVIICVTEGGETSSVIGTVLGGLEQWTSAPRYAPAESRRRLYFVYNNPDALLRPFDRSRTVLDEPGITRINLTTGPQAITGSTRMQATTVETFVIGSVLEEAVERVLRRFLSRREAARAGFEDDPSLTERLRAFRGILEEVKTTVPSLARLTDLEAETYSSGRFSTYLARDGLITVFIDSTERSPTFRLFPLDTVQEPARKCWIQVWTPAPSLQAAWTAFLGRPFRGLAEAFYRRPFEEEIVDPFLRTKALESLKKAGDGQSLLYDFSFAEPNLSRRGPKPGDLGIGVSLPSDEQALNGAGSPFAAFSDLFRKKGARAALIAVGGAGLGRTPEETELFIRGREKDGLRLTTVKVDLGRSSDPFQVQPHIALKMLLNAHSTAVMAKLGRVVGNTMTNVSPSNLKLVGRATYLIQSHVNDVLGRPAWVRLYGSRPPITYGEANAVLFDTIGYLKERPAKTGQTAEVAVSIIRILESLKKRQSVGPAQALTALNRTDLNRYLAGFI